MWGLLLNKQKLVGGGAVVLMVAASQPALGQSEEDEIAEILVWGTAVTSDLLTLDQDEIAIRQADHLSDLLRIVPGVDVGGTHSVNSRINIRGLDDRELSVYVDGALQTNYLYHHIGNILINSDILSSADIQIGANSVVHGGVGGAVRFETKNASELLDNADRDFGGRLMASYNTNAQKAFSGTAYGQFSDYFDALVYYYYVDRENFKDGSGRKTIGSDGKTGDVLAKIGFTPTKSQRLQVSYELLSDSGDYTQRPDMGVLTNQAITGDILLPTDYERETINVSYELDLGEIFHLDATYYMNDLKLTRDETNPAIPAPSSSLRSVKRAESDNQGINILAVTDVNTGYLGHSLKYGVQYFDQKLSYFADLFAGAAPIEQEAETLSFFLEDEISLTDRIRLRPGVRYTDYEVSYKETSESGAFDDVTFGVAGEVEPIDGLRLLASFTQIFQGPELAEPFVGAGGNKIINSDLEAEEGKNIEVGFRYANEIGRGNIGLGANLFKTTIDGYIGEVAVPGSLSGETQDDNLGSIVIKGFEASLTASYEGWDFFLTHNLSNFDTDELDTAAVSESFREIGNTTSYEITYNWFDQNIVLSLSGQFVAEKTTSLGREKDSYNVHNFMMRWDNLLCAEGLSLTAGVDNLFNKTYTSHASRVGASFHPVFGPLLLDDVEPGRNVKITLAKSF